MAKIEDFGEKIAGAAKDRWRAYADRLGAVPESGLVAEPLARSFPEPNYQALLADGVDPQTVAFLHAIRDQIPAKPRGPEVKSWARLVSAVRGLCLDLAEGRMSFQAVHQRLQGPGLGNMAAAIEGATALYQALGHARSFKKVKVGQQLLRERGGVTFDPPLRHWVIQGSPTPGRLRGPILAAETSLERAVSVARDHLLAASEGAACKKMRTQFQIYRRKDQGDAVIIGARIGKSWIDLETFPSPLAARTYLADHADALEEKLERLRRIPSERRTGNDPREGRDWRQGQDIGAGVFDETFRFRGVQFGNYVENDRRQQDLNDAWDALHDLAEVLGWSPASLSLGGQLGLAFGARGRGGLNAAAAHYEPDQRIINLTKTRGPGSLAHEWFHALDNAMARKVGRAMSYASEGQLPSPQTGDLSAFPNVLKRTGIPERSHALDVTRREPYWGTGREMAARAFEAWIIHKLGAKGCRNDWLANVVEERVFEAEAALLGQPAGRYPYPKAAEMAVLDDAFSRILSPQGAIARHFHAQDMAPPLRDGLLQAPATPFAIMGPAGSRVEEILDEDGEIEWDP